MCEVLAVKRSGYYAWAKRTQSKRHIENEQLLQKIELEYLKSRRLYGSRRGTAALRNRGIHCGHNRLARLMQEHGLRSLRKEYRRISTTDSKHDNPIAPNLLGRNFEATRPNQAWVVDLTYIPTNEGWLYLAAVEDLCLKKSGRMVHGRSYDQGTDHERLETSNQSLQASQGIATPFRSGITVYLWRLSTVA
jgi:transposase InsO family protein